MAANPARRPVYVARLLVDPTSRRNGVGRLLLEHARMAALAAVRSPFLDVVDTPTGAAAISLYRDAGWDEIGRVRFRSSETRWSTNSIFCGPRE